MTASFSGPFRCGPNSCVHEVGHSADGARARSVSRCGVCGWLNVVRVPPPCSGAPKCAEGRFETLARVFYVASV